MTPKIFVLPAMACLAACSSGSSTHTAAGLLNDDGTFVLPFSEARGATVRQPGSENGYAFQVGFNDDHSAFVNQAVIIEGTNVGRPLAEGSAEMTGTFQLETLENPPTDNTGTVGIRQSVAEDITIDVNFLDNRISGANEGLALDGVFQEDGSMQGTASFDGMSGELVGQVGAETALGVFNGENATGVFAGGFIVVD